MMFEEDKVAAEGDTKDGEDTPATDGDESTPADADKPAEDAADGEEKPAE